MTINSNLNVFAQQWNRAGEKEEVEGETEQVEGETEEVEGETEEVEGETEEVEGERAIMHIIVSRLCLETRCFPY